MLTKTFRESSGPITSGLSQYPDMPNASRCYALVDASAVAGNNQLKTFDFSSEMKGIYSARMRKATHRDRKIPLRTIR